jgi:hypothetical protein
VVMVLKMAMTWHVVGVHLVEQQTNVVKCLQLVFLGSLEVYESE